MILIIIILNYTSGSWGNEFINLPAIKDKDTNGIDIDVIISSETIYSLDTLPIVAESIKLFSNNLVRALY